MANNKIKLSMPDLKKARSRIKEETKTIRYNFDPKYASFP